MDETTKPAGAPAPYSGPKLAGAREEIFVADAFADDDERLWVPLAPGRWSRPLCLCASQGYWMHLTRVRGGGLVSRHRHPAPVHGFVIKGRWRYLEHDWVAGPGSYIFEPPGDVHTLVVDDGPDDMLTLFHVTGALINYDEDGNVTGSVDVFDRIQACRTHFENVGLGADYVERFVR